MKQYIEPEFEIVDLYGISIMDTVTPNDGASMDKVFASENDDPTTYKVSDDLDDDE